MNKNLNLDIDNEMPRSLPRHPIQVVSRRTGLSSDVIRVWERRYRAVEPEREATGRRLYSDVDIERLSLLQRVTGAGRRISEVAGLDNEALEQITREDRENESSLLLGTAATRGIDSYVSEAFQAIREMNPHNLHAILSNASAELPMMIFLEQVITILLRQIGEGWKKGTLRVGHEHMASMVVRRLLAGMIGRKQNSGELIVITTLAGHNHELGAIMAAIMAETEGWRSIYLGPDLPAPEISASAIQTGARAVGISLQYRGDKTQIGEELRQLRLALPDAIDLVVGGNASTFYEDVLEEIGARHSQNLRGFREILASL